MIEFTDIIPNPNIAAIKNAILNTVPFFIEGIRY
jgi:hypothetical protein